MNKDEDKSVHIVSIFFLFVNVLSPTVSIKECLRNTSSFSLLGKESGLGLCVISICLYTTVKSPVKSPVKVRCGGGVSSLPVALGCHSRSQIRHFVNTLRPTSLQHATE